MVPLKLLREVHAGLCKHYEEDPDYREVHVVISVRGVKVLHDVPGREPASDECQPLLRR